MQWLNIFTVDLASYPGSLIIIRDPGYKATIDCVVKLSSREGEFYQNSLSRLNLSITCIIETNNPLYGGPD